jgi:hypothetical protein
MATYSGNIGLDTYNIRHAISGECSAQINELSVSGGTSPYKVSWSGPSSYTANTFGIYNLCSGGYVASLTDSTGGTGTTTFTINAIERPTIYTNISNTACITNVNGKCQLTVSSTTIYTAYYMYELSNSTNIVETYTGTSADTTYTFSGLPNSIYYVTVTNFDGSDGSVYYDSESGITGTTLYETKSSATTIPYRPTTTVGVTATTVETRNTIKSSGCDYYIGCTSGNTIVRPKVNVTLQTTPKPTLTVLGTSTSTVKLSDSYGHTPNLEVYNGTTDKTISTNFILGGNNDDIILGNTYPKFKVLPYVFNTEQLATLPDYEGLFDVIPVTIDESTKSELVRAEANIPINLLSTKTSWEFIVRPSYITKDKVSGGDLWVDTDTHINISKINNSLDRYVVVVNNPTTPELKLDGFTTTNNSVPSLRTEQSIVSTAPDITATTYSSYTYFHTLQSVGSSNPLVTVNGVIMLAGLKGQADYRFYTESRAVKFHEETIQNGDVIQFIYDANGGSYIQPLIIPETVDTDVTDTVFEKDDYYYINLDKQSSGAVVVGLNGTALVNGKDYNKSGEKQIMLMDKTLYSSGDVVSLFYRTIYEVISFTTTKEPIVPVVYTKTNNLVEEVLVRLFDSNGDEKTKDIIRLGINDVGSIFKQTTLKPPTYGDFTYDVLVKRYYPLMNGETITTESLSDRIPFTITRDVFYSPA